MPLTNGAILQDKVYSKYANCYNRSNGYLNISVIANEHYTPIMKGRDWELIPRYIGDMISIPAPVTDMPY